MFRHVRLGLAAAVLLSAVGGCCWHHDCCRPGCTTSSYPCGSPCGDCGTPAPVPPTGTVSGFAAPAAPGCAGCR